MVFCLKDKYEKFHVCCFVGNTFFQTLSCREKFQKVKSKYSNGAPNVIYEYPDKEDTSKYEIKIYYSDGKIYKAASIDSGKYVKPITVYYRDGKIKTIDSPYDKISGRFEIKNTIVNGLTQHFDSNVVLVKEYYVINDTIKNGDYKEFYDKGKILVKATYKQDTMVGYLYEFKDIGDTLKYYNTFKGGEDMPYKRWLDNGTILTGDYADSHKTAVVWRWFDKNGKELKRKIGHPLPNGAFVSPERN